MTLLRASSIMFAVGLVIAAPPTNAATAFGFSGSAQSFVGNGETQVLIPSDGYQMGVQLDFNNAIHFHAIGNNSVYNPWRSQLPTGFTPKPTDPLSWWELTVGVGGGVLPYIGEFKDPPTPPDFIDPFVHFSGNFRTTNQTSGGFIIRELSFDSSRNEILSFALDFVVLEENDISKRDIGFIRFNSDIAIPAVPEPSVAALLSIGLAASVFVRRRQTAQKTLA